MSTPEARKHTATATLASLKTMVLTTATLPESRRRELCSAINVNQRAIGTHDQRANGTRTSGCTGRSRAVLDAPAFVAGFDDVAVMGEAIE